MKPAAALDAIGALRAAAGAVIDAGDGVGSDQLAALDSALKSVAAIAPSDPADEGWADVDAAFADLVEWLGQPPSPSKAQLTRDEQIKIAAAAFRVRGGRRNDLAEAIISTFEAGLVGAVKLAWATVKLTARVGIAAGILAGRGIAIAATAAADGLVRVQSYMRADGTEVGGYERARPKAMQIAHRPFAFKLAGVAADGTFEGYGSIFGVVDTYNDIVVKGAFAESLVRLKSEGRRVKMLWQHRHDEPIGVWDEIAEDDVGLKCRGRLLLDVQRARECYALMKAGAIDGLSIGYEATRYTNVAPEDVESRLGTKWGGYGMGTMGQIRLLEACDLWEISPVTFPACEPATVTTVKQHRAGSLDLSSVASALARRGDALRTL